MTIVYLDVEHNGKPYPTLRLVQLAINEAPVKVFTAFQAQKVQDILRQATIIVAHNGFDDVHLIAQTFYTNPHEAYNSMVPIVFDTMIAARHAGAPGRVGLAELAQLWLVNPAKPQALAELKQQKDHNGKQFRWGGTNPNGWAGIALDNPAYLRYAVSDVEDMRQCYLQRLQYINSQHFHLDMECHRILADVSRRGIYIDTTVAGKMREQTTLLAQAEYKRCQDLGCLNPNSPAQVAATLSQASKDRLPQTPKGDLSVNAAALQSIADIDPLAHAVLAYRHNYKLLNTYYDTYLAKHTKIHPSYNVVGAVTGRMSSYKPNIQQVPSSVRPCLRAQQGYVLVCADYTAIEARICALVTRDPTLLRDITSGIDIHQRIADLAGVSRSKAKPIFFGRMYGGGEQTLAIQAGIDVETVRSVLNAIDKRYPRIRHFSLGLQRYIRNGLSHVETIAGRKIPIDKEHAHQGLNWIIQGTGADIIKQALWDVKIAFSTDFIWAVIHDEIIIQVPEKWAQLALHRLINTMETTATYKGLSVPITVKGKILGTHWE